MPRKRARIPVVFDTNLFVTRFIKHDRHGINRRVMDLWQSQRKLQLIISPPVKREYLRVLEAYAGIAPDVCDIPKADLRGLRFEIVTPLELLQKLGELSSYP